MATSFASTLTNNSNVLFTFACNGNTLPDDIYTDRVIELTNTTTSAVYPLDLDSNGNEIPQFEISSYPLQTDLSTINLSTWNDGVWAMSVQFYAPDYTETYQSQSYCLSMYDIDCGITKFVASIGCNNNKAIAKLGKMLTLRNAIDLLFAAGDYAQCNTDIRVLQNMLTNEGCGCGC